MSAETKSDVWSALLIVAGLSLVIDSSCSYETHVSDLTRQQRSSEPVNLESIAPIEPTSATSTLP